MKTLLTIIALFLVTSSAAFAQQKKTKYVNVPVEKADKVMKKKSPVVLDVRTPEEVAEGTIPGSLNYNFNAPEFKEQLAALDKSQPYLVYCRSGKRSGKTIEMMKEMGFLRLYEMKAGFPAYAEYKKKGTE
jgi:phage shock protein E